MGELSVVFRNVGEVAVIGRVLHSFQLVVEGKINNDHYYAFNALCLCGWRGNARAWMEDVVYKEWSAHIDAETKKHNDLTSGMSYGYDTYGNVVALAEDGTW